MFEIASIPPQLEFPAQDLATDRKSEVAVMMQNKNTVEFYHKGSEGVFAYSRLHPLLTSGFSEVYDDAEVQAMDHGVKVFEAISAALISKEAMTISAQSLRFVLTSPTAARMILDPVETQEASMVFRRQMPNTAEAVIDSGEVFYEGYEDYVVAGAALECMLVSRALKIERALVVNREVEAFQKRFDCDT